MAFLAPALPFIAAGASVIQGVGGFMAGQSNRRALRDAAGEELRASQGQERELRADARRTIGAQLTAQWGSGLEGGTGTALDALRESELEAVLDAREIRRQGTSRAGSLRTQGRMEAREGAFGLAASMIGGATTGYTMRRDWAQARDGSSGGRR